MDTIQPTIPAQSSASSRRWWVLAIVGIAELMIVLDTTIVNIAFPSAQHAFGFANSDREWIVTAYALAFGSFLLPGGRLGDIFGRKWTFIGVPRQATRWSLPCRNRRLPGADSPADSCDTARLTDEGCRVKEAGHGLAVQ